MADEIRAFLALEIPDSIKEIIAEHQARWERSLPKASWVRPGNQHLTLKFLGSVKEARLQRLTTRLASELGPRRPVDVVLGATGCFPTVARPKIAWIGGTASGVEEAVEVVERVAHSVGFKRERRKWSLHLTVARIRGAWGRGDGEAFVRRGVDLQLPAFSCREVVLFASELRPTGAVYSVIERLPFTDSV